MGRPGSRSRTRRHRTECGERAPSVSVQPPLPKARTHWLGPGGLEVVPADGTTPDPTPRPIDPDNFRKRVWPKLLEKTKLRAIRIHDLRHTFASLLISQGESLAYVREQMGHHSIALTVDTYSHLVPGGNRAAVDRLASCIKSAGMRAPSGPPLDQGGPQSRRSAIGSPDSAALQVEPKGVEPSTSRVRF